VEARCEGLGLAQERLLLGKVLKDWHRQQNGLVLPPDVAASERFLELLTRGPPGVAVCTATSFQPLAALSSPLDIVWKDQGERREIPAEERLLPPLSLESGPLNLYVANSWAIPIRHWLQLLWANLLGMGPFLWSALVGSGARAIFRALWVFLKARSFNPYRLAAAATIRELGAEVHPTAVVEGCFLGKKARIGAGSVVRGCILGEGAVIEEMAIVEGSVLGPGSRIQRIGGLKFSVLEEAAVHAGLAQLGVIGRDAVIKHGVALMDMALGRGARVMAGGKLVDAPFGLAGVCVGPRAVIGQGVKIAPGRVVPAGVTILPATTDILTRLELPEGVTRARVEGNRLVPE
jgi:acetyltransferase-like isoleucine patch superfamily enzyme